MKGKTILEELKELALRYLEEAVELQKAGFEERAVNRQGQAVGVLSAIYLLDMWFGEK